MTILRFESEPTKEQVKLAVDALKAVRIKSGAIKGKGGNDRAGVF